MYEAALSSANLEAFRFRDADRIIAFESGVEFKLHSAETLQAQGESLEASGYPYSSEINLALTLVFRLRADGRLGVTSQIDPESKLAQIGAGFPGSDKQVISQSEFDQLPEAKQAFILANPGKYLIR